MYRRDRPTGEIVMMSSASAGSPIEFIMKQLLGIDTSSQDVYVGVINSFDVATGQASVTFKKVTITVSVAP
jgi:hypothetical protein